MTHTEKDLKNKKQEDIFYYFLIGVFIILSLLQLHLMIYRILFIQPAIQPTKGDFGALLLSIWLAAELYLVDIKQVTEKSEKRALWKIVIMGAWIIVFAIIIFGVYSIRRNIFNYRKP